MSKFNYDAILNGLRGKSVYGVSVGCDPELFLVDEQGKPVSAIGMIGAGKLNPQQVDVMADGFKLQEDNVAVEYNTPATTHSGLFASGIVDMRRYIHKNIAAPRGLRISTAASLQFPADQLDNEAAQTFGCDPDFNVYDLAENPRPKTRDKSLRSAGGHIHVGLPGEFTDNEKIVIAQMIELYVGTQLAILDPDKRRMKLYGKAGAIRFKPYGFEYRTPSNLWSFLDAEAIAHLCTAVYSIPNGLERFSKVFEPRYAMLARAAINTGNKKLLEEMWDQALKKNYVANLLRSPVREQVRTVLSAGVLTDDLL